MAVPPDSVFMTMLKRAAEIVQADSGLQSYFGWQSTSGDAKWDANRRKRICLDDNGTCSEAQSPKLVLCEVHQDNDFSLLGDGGNVDSDIMATIGIIVYVHVPEEADGESQQILCGNLHSAVRQVIRRNCVEPNEGLWRDVEELGPSCSFDASKGWRRAGGLIGVKSQRRIT